MKRKILALTTLLIIFVSPALIANASEPEKVPPLADTYVDAWEVTSSHGERDYLEVSDYSSGFCIALLMFDLSEVSHVISASSEVKLRLYCFSVDSPHIVGVHWCVNNTWKEGNLTFISFSGFFKTDPEDAVRVDSDVWYEWKVTNFVSNAVEENYERITLTLEVEDRLDGMARSLYASKDQQDQELREYSPQLVFTYLEPKANSLDPIIIVAAALAVIVGVALIAYKFLKRTTRKTRRSGARPR